MSQYNKMMSKKDRSSKETEENGRITGGICGKTTVGEKMMEDQEGCGVK